MLYQQNTQRIEIIIRKDTIAMDATTDTDKVSSQDGGGADTPESQGGSSSRKKKLLLTNLTHALSTTKMVADLAVEYELGGLGYKTGDQAYQDRIQRQFESVKDTTNIASSVALGALYGSHGGWRGAFVGATLGLIKSVASTAFKYKGRDRDYTYKVFKENNSIEYVKSRANINLTTGRLR